MQALSPGFSLRQGRDTMQRGNQYYIVLFRRPVAGSKTDIRGKRAHTHISREVLQLCQIIYEHGEPIEDMTEDGRNQIVISFGELFQVQYDTQLNWLYICHVIKA